MGCGSDSCAAALIRNSFPSAVTSQTKTLPEKARKGASKSRRGCRS
jgi:hypothetical protein